MDVQQRNAMGQKMQMEAKDTELQQPGKRMYI